MLTNLRKYMKMYIIYDVGPFSYRSQRSTLTPHRNRYRVTTKDNLIGTSAIVAHGMSMTRFHARSLASAFLRTRGDRQRSDTTGGGIGVLTCTGQCLTGTATYAPYTHKLFRLVMVSR